MKALRFVIYNLLSWVSVPPFALLILLAWPFSHALAYKLAHTWAILVLWLVKIVCGLSYRVEGQENIPDHGSIVFIKHSSAFETVASLAVLPRSCWVLKRELVWVPFFGWTLIPLDAIAIDRSKGSAAVNQVIEQGKDRLARGINVVIFPEGTRMKAGTTKRYGLSGTLLAQESNSLVVPIAHDAGYYWPRRGFGITPGEIVISVGKPVDPAGKDPREFNAEVQDWVETEVRRIRNGK